MWGTDLFSDDLACDIRDHYRELLEDGIEDVAATRLILEKFQAYLEESEGIALLAFAGGSTLKIPSLARWRRTLVLLAFSAVRRLQ